MVGEGLGEIEGEGARERGGGSVCKRESER